MLKALSESPEGLEKEIQQICLEILLSTTTEKAESLLETLQKSLQAPKDPKDTRWEQWSQDMAGFAKNHAETKQMEAKSIKTGKFAGWKIGLTRDPVDMLLLASETAGCQSIDGTPYLNKCALAYVIDYKNSALVIKDKEGKIKARAILRALYDKENKTPVLFLERHYASVMDSALNAALNAYAKEYAREANLPLLTKEAANGSPYAGTLSSLGSNAVFEYSDAGGGVTKGIFEIAGSRVMT